MPVQFNYLVDGSVERYSYFLNILRSQVDTVIRRGPADMQARDEAVRVATGAARSYASQEAAFVTQYAEMVATDAYNQALQDMHADPGTMPDTLTPFIDEAALYSARLLAAQADRDVVAMAQQIRDNANRTDLYIRSGRTRSNAVMTVIGEDNVNPAFRFVDRIGRQFKSSKQVRDVVRLNLLSIYNEVYIAAAFDGGHTQVEITHPDPNYKWFGQKVAIIGGEGDFPLYYDIRDEVFHPSSDARITLHA